MSFYITRTQNLNKRSVDSLLIYKNHTIFKLVNNEYISLFNNIECTGNAISVVKDYFEANAVSSLEIDINNVPSSLVETLLFNITEYLSNSDLSIGLLVKAKSFISEHKNLLDKYGVMYVKEKKIKKTSAKKILKHPDDELPYGTSFLDIDGCKLIKNPAKPQQNSKNEIELDISFLDLLFEYLRSSNKSNIEIYKKAGISRQVFSKTLCNKVFIPKKETIICLIIGLELAYDDAIKLLNSAGYTLSSSILFDCVITKFLKKRCYNLDKINEELDEFGLPLLGWKPRDEKEDL